VVSPGRAVLEPLDGALLSPHSSENLHAPRERLSQKSLYLHFAIVSLMEELDAIDWYRQRADDAEDETLKGLLLHKHARADRARLDAARMDSLP
jgi:hypothetical protein